VEHRRHLNASGQVHKDVRPRVSPDLERRFAQAIEEEEPADLGPARLRALKRASPGDYYVAVDALRREEWKRFLGYVPPSQRRAALRSLEDVVPAAELPALRRVLPPSRKRAS
jgi:hypothetical protein